MSSEASPLNEDDILAIVRLLGDVAGEQAEIAVKRRQILEGLAAIVGAESWIWSMLGDAGSDGVPQTVLLHGGFSEERFVAYLKFQEHPDMKRLTAPLYADLLKARKHLTRLQLQLITREALSASDILSQQKACDLGPVILSARPTPSNQFGVVSLFRGLEAPPFTERDSRIAHMVLGEISWLFEKSWPNYPRQKVSSLSPRQHSILTALLQGRARKQIAADFELSIHTVGGYVKEIYRHFGVNSHAELMRRFVNGDGDTAAPLIRGVGEFR